MTRGLTAPQQTTIAGEIIRPAHLVELDFASGLIRATDAPFSIFYDSDGDTVDEEFLGVGDLGRIGRIEESAEARASRLTLTLTGVKDSLISISLNEQYQGRPARLWKAYLKADNSVDFVVPAFIGIIDTMTARRGPETGELSIDIINRMVLWERGTDNPRMSNEDQQMRFPGDKYFEFMPQIAAGKEVFWGRG